MLGVMVALSRTDRYAKSSLVTALVMGTRARVIRVWIGAIVRVIGNVRSFSLSRFIVHGRWFIKQALIIGRFKRTQTFFALLTLPLQAGCFPLLSQGNYVIQRLLRRQLLCRITSNRLEFKGFGILLGLWGLIAVVRSTGFINPFIDRRTVDPEG
jgi:hypothetical protein